MLVSDLLRRQCALWLCLSLCGWIFSGCSSDRQSLQAGAAGYALYPDKPGLFVSAALAPDGRLWRVVTTSDHVYVDYSVDKGNSFSAPVLVNSESQRIRTSIENRPGIAVDAGKRIYVIYPAEGQQPAALFLSVSTDQGRSFSKPAPLSAKAAEAISLQGTLATDPQGKTQAFWHDDRDRVDYKQLGNNVYYADLSQGAIPPVDHKAYEGLCECCRLAVDFDANQPVIFGRFIYQQGARDHGLIKSVNGLWQSQRVSNDDWRIEACPEQGPALSISDNGQYHLAWFTQGTLRQGLFYAHSFDHGQQFSQPLPIGNPAKLPKFPAVLSRGNRVALAWIEFDGQTSRLMTMQSTDSGQSWSPAQAAAESTSAADRPVWLLGESNRFYLSWNTRAEGYRLLPYAGSS